MSDAVLAPSIQGYQPLMRMQEKAAQLRQELETVAKGDRHAQFKRSSSRNQAGAHSAAGATASWAGGAPGGREGGSVLFSIQGSTSTALAALSPSRRFRRSVTAATAASAHSSHSVSTYVPQGGGAAAAATAGLAAASGLQVPDRQHSTSGAGGMGAGGGASRLPSRRVSTASGAATDVSGDEPRVSANGFKSPSSRGRGHRSSRGAALRDVTDYAAAISRQNQLEDMVAELEGRIRELSTDNDRRQDSYMRREADLSDQVVRLEEALRKARGEHLDPGPEGGPGGGGAGGAPAGNEAVAKAAKAAALDRAAGNIRELHTQVVSRVEDLLTAQAATLKAEENSTLRRFTTRLSELEAAVTAERARGQSLAEQEGAERIKALTRERDNMQEIAMILDKKHSLMAEENARLRAQFKLQEEDREYLIKQTVALKKENQALRNQLAALMQNCERLNEEKEELEAAVAAGAGASSTSASGFTAAGGSRPSSSRGGGSGAATAALGSSGPEGQIALKLQRYEDVVDSLKRLLEAERRRTKQARAAHTLELQQRTGLQAVLRQCVEDVRDRRRALEAEGQRDRAASDRVAARSRPPSALRHAPPAAPVARPLSAMVGPATSHRRPASAGSALTATGSGGASGGADGLGVLGPPPALLSPVQREELISRLLAHEEVLRAVFDKSFPGVTPHPPSDPYLDRMAAWQEQRDAQVAANAKVLSAAKNAVLPPATAVKESTPGGMLLKEAANRPWVLNVDAMLADFLGGGVGGGGGGAGGSGAAPSSKSLGGASSMGASGGGA